MDPQFGKTGKIPNPSLTPANKIYVFSAFLSLVSFLLPILC